MKISINNLIPDEFYLISPKIKVLEAQDVFDPILVVERSGYFLVTDGNHRAYVQVKKGLKEIEVKNNGSAREKSHIDTIDKAIKDGGHGAPAFLSIKLVSSDGERRNLTKKKLEQEDSNDMFRALKDADERNELD